LTTLTKVFIVVLAVFAIAFSMLVIAYTAQSTNYRQLADYWKTQAAQEQTLRQASDNWSKIAGENLQKQISQQQEQLSKLRAEMDKSNAQVASLNNELLAERQKTASLTGQVTQLTSMINAGDAERKELQNQLESLRKDNTGLRTDNFRLAESNQKLELQRQLYEQEIRLLKEQNFSLGEKLEGLRTQGGGSTASAATPASPGQKAQAATESEASPIVGQITDIRDSLAGISIGSAQGVREGMEFIVYRGAQYLGKLKISRVQPEQAAGELIQKQGNIRPGDKVTDKFQL